MRRSNGGTVTYALLRNGLVLSTPFGKMGDAFPNLRTAGTHVKLKITGFTDQDEQEFDPITFEIPWRGVDDDTDGIEEFEAYPRIPLGPLFSLEVGDGAAMADMINMALRDDDGGPDDKADGVDTSSRARWVTLINDPKRQVPGTIITQVLRGLYVEYTERRGPLAVQTRPTKPAERSSGSSSRTGRTSTAKRANAASTSEDSPQMSE